MTWADVVAGIISGVLASLIVQDGGAGVDSQADITVTLSVLDIGAGIESISIDAGNAAVIHILSDDLHFTLTFQDTAYIALQDRRTAHITLRKTGDIHL